MKRLFSFLLWSLVFLLIAIGLDQFFVRIEMRQPVLAEIRAFHVDFRTRLLHLVDGLQSADMPVTKNAPLPSLAKTPTPAAEPASWPSAAAGGKQKQPLAALPAPAASQSNPRFLYTDAKGSLLFADRLEDIPADYRGAAQPLAR